MFITPQSENPQGRGFFRIYNEALEVEYQALVDGMFIPFLDAKNWEDTTGTGISAETAARVFGELYDFWKENSMNLCDAIIACIQANPTAYQNALGIGGAGGGGGKNPSVTISPTGLGNIIAGFGCSEENACAYAYGITDTVYAMVTQFFQVLETATNGIELASGIASQFPSLPVIGIAIGGMAEITDWVLETAYDAWYSGYNEITTRDEIAQDIYCLILDDCSITFDDLLAYFASKAVIDIFNTSLEELVENSIALFDANAIMWTMQALAMATLSIGEQFGGVLGASGFYAAIAKYKNDVSNDCGGFEPCPTDTPCVVYEFSANTQGWAVSQGQYVTSTTNYYRTGVLAGNTARRFRGESALFSVPLAFNRVEIDYNVLSLGTGYQNVEIIDYDNNVTVLGSVAPSLGAGTWSIVIPAPLTQSGLRLHMQAASSGSIGEIRIFEIRLYCT